MRFVSLFYCVLVILMFGASLDAQTHQSQIIIEHAPQGAVDGRDSHSRTEAQSSPTLLMGVGPHGVQPIIAIPLGNNIPPEKREKQSTSEKKKHESEHKE
jgi:hypothetical protein